MGAVFGRFTCIIFTKPNACSDTGYGVHDRKFVALPCPLRSSASFLFFWSSIGQKRRTKGEFKGLVSRKIRVYALVSIVILHTVPETNETHRRLVFDTVLVSCFVFCQTPLFFNRRRTRKLQTSYENSKNHDIIAVVFVYCTQNSEIENKNM